MLITHTPHIHSGGIQRLHSNMALAAEEARVIAAALAQALAARQHSRRRRSSGGRQLAGRQHERSYCASVASGGERLHEVAAVTLLWHMAAAAYSAASWRRQQRTLTALKRHYAWRLLRRAGSCRQLAMLRTALPCHSEGVMLYIRWRAAAHSAGSRHAACCCQQ